MKNPHLPLPLFPTYKVCLNICTNSYLYAVGLGQTPLQLKLLININSRRLNSISPNTGHCIACCRLEEWHDTSPPTSTPLACNYKFCFFWGGEPRVDREGQSIFHIKVYSFHPKFDPLGERGHVPSPPK